VVEAYVDRLIQEKEGRRTKRIRRDRRIKPRLVRRRRKRELAQMRLESTEKPRERELREREWSGVWSDPSCCNQGSAKSMEGETKWGVARQEGTLKNRRSV
jgi:hypothetical protein